MFKVKIALFLSFCGLVISGNDLLRPHTIRFYVFEGTCPDHPNIPIISTVKITTVRRTFYVNMKINITEDIKSEDMQMILYMERCQNRDSLDSCEPYKTIKMNYCKLVNNENMPWSKFLNSIEPFSPHCPLKKGVYEVRNGTFNLSEYTRFPISDIYWRIKVIIKSNPGDKIVQCYRIEGQIAPV